MQTIQYVCSYIMLFIYIILYYVLYYIIWYYIILYYIMLYYIILFIYIGSRLGVPRSFQEPSVLSLYYKRRYGIEMGGGGVGGVTTSCGARWIQSCGNLEDVASLTMLLRCKYRCCSRSKQLLQKAFVDVKMKKVWCSFRPWSPVNSDIF